MSTSLRYDELVAALQQLVEDKRSTTMYIKTNDNRLAMWVLRNGEIDAMMYGAARGSKALKNFLSVTGGTYRLANDGLKLPSGDLPNTVGVLNLLLDGQNRTTVDNGNHGHQATPQGPAIPYSPALAVVAEGLGDFLGPIAEMVTNDIIDSGKRPHGLADWGNVIQRLSREIPDSDEAKQFTQKTTRALQKL